MVLIQAGPALVMLPFFMCQPRCRFTGDLDALLLSRGANGAQVSKHREEETDKKGGRSRNGGGLGSGERASCGPHMLSMKSYQTS